MRVNTGGMWELTRRWGAKTKGSARRRVIKPEARPHPGRRGLMLQNPPPTAKSGMGTLALGKNAYTMEREFIYMLPPEEIKREVNGSGCVAWDDHSKRKRLVNVHQDGVSGGPIVTIGVGGRTGMDGAQIRQSIPRKAFVANGANILARNCRERIRSHLHFIATGGIGSRSGTGLGKIFHISKFRPGPPRAGKPDARALAVLNRTTTATLSGRVLRESLLFCGAVQ